MAKRKPLPRQKQLPGIQNAKIASIENLAFRYAEIRDARMELNKQEADLHKKMLGLMHKLKKTDYRRAGIHVWLQKPETEDKVKVRVKEEDEMPEKLRAVPEPDEEEREETPDDEQEQEEEEEESESSSEPVA